VHRPFGCPPAISDYGSLLSGAAAAAHEVERADDYDRDHNQDDVEHGTPFLRRTGCPSFVVLVLMRRAQACLHLRASFDPDHRLGLRAITQTRR
jgi:hypothetical protein